jgi:hypothetical protein
MDSTTKICLTILAGISIAAAVVSGIWIGAEVVAVFSGLAGTAIGGLAGIAVQNKVM